MLGECNIGLGGNFAKICGYKPKSGLKKKWYGNVSDIDKEATILINRGTKITTLVLKLGAKLYPVLGNDKTNGLKSAGVVGDYSNGFAHTDVVNILYRGENERERVQEIVDGARIFSIVEKVDGGENGELAFEIAGFESGMLFNAYENDFIANSGVATLTVATKEGEEEGTDAKLFQDTDYATTLAFLEANTLNADAVAPTAPTNLVSSGETATSANLAWDASADAVGVTGYKIYQDAVLIQTLTGTLIATVNGLVASTAYSFTVSAIDAAGNESAQSTPLVVNTPI
jgi:hypothetical protein